jgi:hypothetical protein
VSAAEQALAYARDRGWPVFPTKLVPRPDGTFDKVPCVKWAKDEADRAAVDARDPSTIRKWWRRWPEAVISIPTGSRSGIIVLDIDCKKGRNGFDTLADLGKAILPDTPISHTPSGGVHVYFARTELEIRNSAGTKGLGTGLDIRGDGGQVVLPSSDSGYWWDPHSNFDTVALLPAPAWLGHREKRPTAAAGSRPGRALDPGAILRNACDNIRAAADGERHDILNREAYSIGGLVGAGALDQAIALHELEAATLAMAWRSGGDRDKAERDLASAFAEGMRAPWRAGR